MPGVGAWTDPRRTHFDGSCRDDLGSLAELSRCRGARVVRFSPDGELTRILELVCGWGNKLHLRNARLGTLPVTSARGTMTPSG